MPDINEKMIEMALKDRLLTRKQADLIRRELQTDTEGNAGELMLRRHYITEEQLGDLWAILEGGEEPLGDSAGDSQPISQETAQLPPSIDDSPSEQPVGIVQLQVPSRAKYQTPQTLVGLLRLARHWGCSDLHLSVGRPPFVRLNGDIRYMETDVLAASRAEELNFSALTDAQRHRSHEQHGLDFALEVTGVGRHRCSIFEQRLGWDGAYRIVPTEIPTLESLGLPPHFESFTHYENGLIMVTGPAGSGKSTTLAALVDIVNQERHGHIITIEDPVEYIIPAKNCQTTQRETPRHSRSFGTALRAATREDPDLIMVGELHDLETTSIAMSAAETGYLVFSSLRTGSAIRAVDRLIDVYPLDQQRQAHTTIAESLRVVITQQLALRKDGSGRVPAVEVLVNTAGVGQLIKEGKTQMLISSIQSGKRSGMISMDESLLTLVTQGIISGREAYNRANNKQLLEKYKDQA